MQQYVEKLIEEIQEMGMFIKKHPPGVDNSWEIATIFIGGGTPSILETEQLGRIMKAVKDAFFLFNVEELTIEANPGTLNKEKLFQYKSFGINRLSIGLQSVNNRELEELGRVHTYEEFLKTFHMAREAGFNNINIDLMSALPGQTPDTYRQALEEMAGLSPEHISAYSLIIEEGTPFYERYGQMGQEIAKYGQASKTTQTAGLLLLPDEETEREMYHLTKTCLKELGYERYEISNYARPGKECLHNTGYWTGTDYLGLGLGASSYLSGERFQNEASLSAYLKYSRQDFRERRHHKERKTLTRKEKMEEFMFLGLRLTKGVAERDFFSRFGVTLEEIYNKTLLQAVKENLITEKNGCWQLTGLGMDVSNYVLSKFLL